MRSALVVGIDHYAHAPRLFGCCNDAHAVKHVLTKDADGAVNFDVRSMISTELMGVSRKALRDNIRELSTDDDISLLYIAAHGYIEETGGYILSTDSASGEEGIPLGAIASRPDRKPRSTGSAPRRSPAG